MGLNIPYTHSEEKPSRVLLSKSALAGRPHPAPVPDGAHARGAHHQGDQAGRRHRLEARSATARSCAAAGPCPSSTPSPRRPSRSSRARASGRWTRAAAEPPARPSKSVFIDTGRERDLLSRGVQRHHHQRADGVRDPGGDRRRGRPRAAGRQHRPRRDQRPRQRGHGPDLPGRPHAPLGAREAPRTSRRSTSVRSVAFENLGPPRLSKLLLRGRPPAPHLRHHGPRARRRPRPSSPAAPPTLVAARRARADASILSIGIPILLPGRTSPARAGVQDPAGGRCRARPTRSRPERIESWAHAGWVDLREANMAVWRDRFDRIEAEIEADPGQPTPPRASCATASSGAPRA